MTAVNYDSLLQLTSEGLILCVIISLPAVLTSSLVGLLVAFFSAITSLQDSSIAQGVKLLAVTVVVMISAPWAGDKVLLFGQRVMQVLFE